MKQYVEYVIPVILLLFFASWCSCEVEPLTLMGLESGEVLKCRFENSSECAPLTAQAQESGVSALAVSGEFLYLGLQSGVLSRCPLARPHNCTTFHTFLSEINDLAIAGKHIYAAWSEGITKCGLRKSDDCTIYYVSESPVHSLAVFGQRLYAGTNEEILSCPLTDSENCTQSQNLTSAVNALSASGNQLYVGLEEGLVQSCELDDITECSLVFDTTSTIKSLDIFSDYILVSLDTGDIVRFVNDGSNETSIFEKRDQLVLSMFTIFDTTNIKYHYIGENADCTWQFFGCPPYIIYYDVESRAQFELRVKDGKLYTVKDEPFDTEDADFSHSGSKAIFVMDPAGRIYASNTHPMLLLHHSSLMAGDPVAAAGELKVNEGVIDVVSSCSGHYRPSYLLTKQIKIALRRQGYTKTVNVRDCMRMPLMIDLDYKKTALYYKAKYNRYLRKLKSPKLKR